MNRGSCNCKLRGLNLGHTGPDLCSGVTCAEQGLLYTLTVQGNAHTSKPCPVLVTQPPKEPRSGPELDIHKPGYLPDPPWNPSQPWQPSATLAAEALGAKVTWNAGMLLLVETH